MSVRVLRVLTRLGAGGPPLHCALLARELETFGYETVLAVGRCGEADSDMSYVLDGRTRVEWIEDMRPAPSPWADVKAVWSLYRLMRRFRPDIVHTHTAKAGALGRLAAFAARIPVVVHTFHGHVFHGYFPAWASALIRAAEWVLGHATDAVCVLAPSQAREIGAVVAPCKIRVMPLGMDLTSFLAMELPDDNVPFTVAWLGRMVPVKNLVLLREVIERAGMRFLIAGDGPDRGLLEGHAVLEWQRDVRPVITEAHALILTSKNEGTPVSLIQGMAAGRPFVSTRVGGVVDLAESGGGVVTDADAGKLAAALRRLEADPRERIEMGQKGRAFVAEKYSVARLLRDMDELYRDLLSKASRRARGKDKCTHSPSCRSLPSS